MQGEGRPTLGRIEKVVLGAYAVWTVGVVAVCFLKDGLSANNVTRLMILAWLGLSFAWYGGTRTRAMSASGAVFVLKCSASALVVELCYMVSRPVFSSLLVTSETPPAQIVTQTLIDFAFTFPAYLVIFSAFWLLLRRFSYRVGEYALLFSFAQALGDGNAFFLANPGMLMLAPYVMLNYQAIHIVPWLRIRDRLPPATGGVLKFVLPLVVIPAVYGSWVP